METYDYIINDKEYTLIDTYKEEKGTIVQLNSDEDILLLLIDENGNVRKLSDEEDQKFREKNGMIDTGFVSATIKDMANLEFFSKKAPKEYEDAFKKCFLRSLTNIDASLTEDPHIKKRLNTIHYRQSTKGNTYSLDTVYIYGSLPRRLKNWIVFHETVHGIVNKSNLPTYGLIEGITDRMVSLLLPKGNYSLHHQLLGGEILINQADDGQSYLIPFARQLEFALGENFDQYEMFTLPHNQIHKFGEMYGLGKTRMLLHKVNKLYRHCSIEEFIEAQEYMLRVIFDKKLENISDIESAKKFFQELNQLGLLRGRINDRDSALKKYYIEKLEYLKEKGLDVSTIPSYQELSFYPCGDVYFLLNSYITSLENAVEEKKLKKYKILYNKERTCVYIIVDGKLDFIRSEALDNHRLFFNNKIKPENSSVISLENGKYLITGPDKIVEEAMVAYENGEKEEMLEEQTIEEEQITK